MARQRGNKWQADVVINGTRKRVSFDTQAEAENYERLIEQGLEPSNARTLGAFYDEQFNRVWGDNRAIKSVQFNFNTIFRYIPRTTALVTIDEVRIDNMVTDMIDDGLASGTINRKLANLSKLLKRARKLRVIQHMPMIERLTEGKARHRELTPAEEDKVNLYLQQLGLQRTNALVQFLLYTGCRVGEAYRLDRGDVTPSRKVNGEVVQKAKVTFRDTKNGSDRTIPLVDKAEAAWAEICAMTNSERPFEALIPRWTFRGHWERIRDHLGATEDRTCVPHMLRHTCATRLVRAGVDLPRVQKWMGHKSIQVTLRYGQLVPDDLDLAARALV